MRLIDLSHPVRDGMPAFPGDPAPRLERVHTHAADGLQTSLLVLSPHCGTHVDVPLHFRQGEPGLEELPLDAFHGRARVIDAPTGARPGGPGGEIAAAVLHDVDLADLDFLLLRTGWDRHWRTPRYYAGWPCPGEKLIRELAGAGLKGVGLDAPSADPMDGRLAHDLFAAAGMINIENLTRLGDLPDAVFELLVLPLRLEGTEASPVRAVALLP